MVVQPPVPYPYAKRFEWTPFGYHTGIASLAIHGVPYGMTSTQETARSFLGFFSDLYGPHAKVHVVEHGAGLGWLAKYMTQTPTTLSLTYTVCDAFDASIDALKTNDTTPPRCQYATLDLSKDAYLPCDVDVMSYVLDAIPSRYFRRRDNRLEECLVSSYIDNSQPVSVVDNRSFPPIRLTPDQVAEILSRPASDDHMPLAAQLVGALNETQSHIPLSESTASDRVTQTVTAIFDANPDLCNVLLSDELLDSLDRLLSREQDQHVVLLFDFGTYGLDGDNRINTPYLTCGALSYSLLTFEVIEYVAKQKGYHVMVEPVQQQSRYMILAKGFDPLTVSNLFFQHFHTHREHRAVMAATLFSGSQLAHLFQYAGHTLNQELTGNPYAANQMAKKLVTVRNHQLAHDVLWPTVSTGGPLCLQPRATMMSIFNHLAQPERALEVYHQSDPSIQFYMPACIERCIAYEKLGDDNGFLMAAPMAFKAIISGAMPWPLLVAIFNSYLRIRSEFGLSVATYRTWMEEKGNALFPDCFHDTIRQVLKEIR
ncbi:hypothetical protein EBZ35_04070 [bacterium]|nr:hypothetical protein [bacterium]